MSNHSLFFLLRLNYNGKKSGGILSMKYDFVTQVDRTEHGSGKWNLMYSKNPNAKGIVPFSVADMELKNPPEIMEGLQEFLKQDVILGYTSPTERYYDSIVNWMKKRHNWEIDKEWIVMTPGVVSALSIALEAITKPGDGMLIMTPVYYPFRKVAGSNKLNIIESKLIEKDQKYTIDFEDFEAKAKDPNCKVVILCSPHNPIGRVWTKEELTKIAEICLKYDVFMICDEIHNDLIMEGYKHTVLATLSKEVEDKCIICTSVSKTFNLAGLQVSNIIIPNAEVREAFKNVKATRSIGNLNVLSYQACILAYEKCEEWLEELLVHVRNNEQLVKDFIEAELPMLKVSPMEGTYLLWLDCRALNLTNEELEEKMLKHDLYFDEGYIFGVEGSGFERINLACPKETLMAGLQRLKEAITE